MSAAPLLVTGGAGFIGSCFVAQAVARGHKVIVLDALTYAANRANLEGIPNLVIPAKAGILNDLQDSRFRGNDKSGSWELVVGTIADSKLVLALLRKHNIQYIINFAAESHVDNSIAAPAPFIDTNITGTFRLLEAARDYWQTLPEPQKTAFRFLQVSTDEVYGSLGPTGAFSEDSQIRPNSPYSASKAAADHLAHAWFVTYGLPVIVTRSGNNYGPRQHAEKLIPHMISCALAGKPLPVYGDGKHRRAWLHVEDHCDALWLALDKGIPGQEYLFGGDEMENLTLVENICALLDKKRPLPSGRYRERIAHVADRLGHDRRYAIDDTKTKQELGFVRQHDLEKGLDMTIDWYLSHAESKPDPATSAGMV